MSFFDEIKYSFKKNNNFNIIIYINLIVFLLVNLVFVFIKLFNLSDFSIIPWLAVPADINSLLHRPWTLATYMFTHQSFLHILFNLLIFYWFGKLFLQYLSQKQLLGVYILGGLSGAVLYIFAYNVIPAFSIDKYFALAIGASASVMAIVIAVATLVPNQKVYMLFFGEVKLMYLAIAVVVLDVIQIPIQNPGGHIAHLGGAILGYIFVTRYRKGKDITIVITRILTGIKNFFVPEKKIKVTYNNKNKTQHKRPETDMEYNTRKKSEQDEIDKILEKIAKSGYSSLTNAEKEKLFKNSNKK